MIRAAQSKDVHSISKLLTQLGYESPPLRIQKMILKSSDNEHKIYVYVIKEEVIAVMSLIFFDYFPTAKKICRITAIIVDENIRGAGIGSKLIQHAKSEALNNQCSGLEVTTSLHRQQTQEFYQSIGFDKTSYKYIQQL